MRPAASLVAAACSVIVAVVACPGAGPVPDKSCNTAIDCDVTEACREGVCVSLDAGPADEGEGEGNVDDAVAIEAVCERLTACQAGSSVDTCVQDETQAVASLPNGGTDVCTQAADALVALFACAAAAPCTAFNDSGQLQALCPTFDEAESLSSQCSNGPVGEGEGEPDCPSGAFPDPSGETQTIFLERIDGKVDPETDPACGTAFSASLVLSFEGDGTQVVTGASADDEFVVRSLVRVSLESPNAFGATACTDFDGGAIAVQLTNADGTNTNVVCGFVSP
jgi:hypothetical protein